MKTKITKQILLAIAAMGFGICAYAQTYSTSFDNSSSIVQLDPPWSYWQQYGFDGTPAVPNVRVESGSGTISWDGTVGDGGLGAVKAQMTGATDGGQALITLDLFNTAVNATSISFDIMLNATANNWNTVGDLAFVQRDSGYGWNQIWEDPNYNWNDPSTGWGRPYTANTWVHFDLSLAPGTTLRALTIKDYFSSGAGWNNGTVNMWVDNLVVTVPEPSTLVLAGLGSAALLIFRRRK